ncbi:HupE/UreJ family protein [Aquabacter cavernae]|uniref:HupE/UreJ family protein n=1 Tax=Aquabacter cavernae TaxID=2496029 RepID=UPI000F8C5602|nr:HupE/UreJ family protein [Aquabacter cavernae]
MMRSLRPVLAAGLFGLLPSVAFAHTGVGDAHGFSHGFFHPLTGIDHVLAMVAVGILAWQSGGRAVWAVPLAFVGLMVAGGALGATGMDLPYVEIGIALSVVVLGAAVAYGVTLPLAAAVGLAGFFALFHGHAHGAEMPENASGLAYGAGFVIATVMLHLAGIGVGMGIARIGERHGAALVRASGAAIALGGVVLLARLSV